MTEINKSPTGREHKQMSDTFSVYPPGYVNRYGKDVMSTAPLKDTTIDNVYHFIKSERWAGNATEELRKIEDHDENCRFKMLNFYVATFSCSATYRKADCVKALSPYMVLDFDSEDLKDAYPESTIEDAIKDFCNKLIADENIATVMYFTSPNGNGVKWVIYVGDRQGLTHREAFDAITTYILQRFGVKADKSGSDICRACYLPFDPDCYLNPNYKELKVMPLNLKVWLNEKNMMDNKSNNNMPTIHSQQSSIYNNVYDLVESWVSRDTLYVKGSFNRYVSKCGYLLCEFGVPEAEAEMWAINRFADYRSSEVKSIISSCYRNGHFGKRTFVFNSKK